MGKKYEPPQTDRRDTAHSIVKAGLSAIPYVGGTAAELLNLLITPSIEKRKQKWMQEIAEGLARLEERQAIAIEELQKDESFVDTLIRASTVAMRTSQQEKLEALRNAVLNSTLAEAPDDSIKQIYLNLIEEFTEWHIRILHVFNNPQSYLEANKIQLNIVSGGLSHVLETALPELRGRRNLYDKLWRDLYQNGLTNTDGLHTMMSAHGLLESRTSDLGKGFLEFIRNPL